MKATERLWTDTELDNLTGTINILRRVRGAATFGLGSQGLMSRMNSKLRGLQAPTDRESIVEEGELLARSAGNFLGKRLAKDVRDAELRERWEEEALGLATEKYGKYPELTAARTTQMEVGGSVISKMRLLTVDPEYLLRWDLTQHNDLGVDRYRDLSEGQTLVVAPFSGDLLLAATYNGFIEARGRTPFPLRGVAGTDSHNSFVIPDMSNELSQVQRIGLYFDAIETGQTGRALVREMRSRYAGIPVIEPSYTPTDFEPSAKIKRLWAEQER